MFAVEAFAQRPNRKDLGVAGFAGAVEDQFGHGRGVQHRFGLWRAAQAGHATGGGRPGFADDAAFTTVAGFAQGNVQVDQAGCGHQALSVEGLDRHEAGRDGAQGDDFAGVDMDVSHLIQAAGRIDHACAENAEFHWAFSWSSWRWAVCPLMAMDSTAMRMAMP